MLDTCQICTVYLGPYVGLRRSDLTVLPELLELSIAEFSNRCFLPSGPFSFLSQYFITYCNEQLNRVIGCHQQGPPNVLEHSTWYVRDGAVKGD